MLLDPKGVELLLVGVPVGANALEHARSVEEGVGHDRDAGLAKRYVVALEEADVAVLVGLCREVGGCGRSILGDHVLAALPVLEPPALPAKAKYSGGSDSSPADGQSRPSRGPVRCASDQRDDDQAQVRDVEDPADEQDAGRQPLPPDHRQEDRGRRGEGDDAPT